MTARGRLTLGVVCLLAFWCVRASAASNEQPIAGKLKEGSGSAFAKGASAKDQKMANELFRQANALLKDGAFVKASATYREAIKLWPHPAIRFNLVLALSNLDQPIEMYEHLTEILKFGPKALPPEMLQKAQSLKLQLEKELSHVEVKCEVPEATVTMDAQPLVLTEGKFEGLVRAGPHVFAATKEGFVTHEIGRALPGESKSTIDIPLKTTDELTIYQRRWSLKLPWVWVGSGAAVSVVGGILHIVGWRTIRDYNRRIEADCGNSQCRPEEQESLASKGSRGRTMQQVAIGAYVVGGLSMATGAVLAYLNRPRPRLLPYDDDSTKPQPPIEIRPVLNRESAGVTALMRF